MITDILKKSETAAADELKNIGFNDGKRALKDLTLLSKGPFKAIEDGLMAVLDDLTASALASPSPDDALSNIEGIVLSLKNGWLKNFLKNGENLKNLAFVCGSSPYLADMLSQDPGSFERLFINQGLHDKKDLSIFTKEITELMEESGAENPARPAGGPTRSAGGFDRVSKVLRKYRNREYIRIGARDLLSLASPSRTAGWPSRTAGKMEETTAELSDLASASLDEGVKFCLKELKKTFGAPFYTDEKGDRKEASFCVIGLGKLGGRDLNFSSDIDIIYIYSSDNGETEGVPGKPDTKIALHAFFSKLAARLTKLLSHVTEDGYVFRVDLDLRPEGQSGDMVNSLRSAEIYYESWGQMWERAAMIKARPVAGDMDLGVRFMEMIGPFTYRKYLDFTAIEEIRGMKERIDLSLLRTRPDAIDVKLGEGGIREIEFFCQALQLIYGGKDPEVREKNTLRAIEKLRGKNLLPDKDASALRDGYVFLRNLEHRIQIKDGRQTHSVPAKAGELTRLARMMGFSDKAGQSAADRFREDYGKKTEAVYSVYRSLFYRGEGATTEGVAAEVLPALAPEVPEDEAVNILAGLGFKDAAGSLKTIRLLRDGPPFLHLGPRARVLLEKLAPLFLSRALASPDADMALKNIERFVSAAGARTGLYSLMAENPRLVGELMRIFGSSAFLSNSLIERPEDLDILFSTEMSRPHKGGAEMAADLNSSLSGVAGDDYEEKLDSIRRWRNCEVFRIGLNDLLGRLGAEEASGEMTTLAETALEAAYKLALQEVRKRYGQPNAVRFFVIGMGKLGAGELIYGSDLDIFFVYEEDEAGGTAGRPSKTAGRPKAVSTHEFFVHIAQRIISILSLRTKEGIVFSVDTRLRPSGSSGPLVVSRSSLLRYHAEKAGVWERQAAIRARAVAGDTGFGERVLKELEGIVYSRPIAPDEVSELLRIRKRMEEEIAKETPERFDIKAGRGGMVDIEFLAQALQLCYGWKEPSLRTTRTLETLQRLSRCGMISPQDCAFLSETYGFYRQMETGLRIVHDSPARVLKKDPTRTAGWPELDTLARRMAVIRDNQTGLALTGEKLLADYLKRREKVRELYLKVMEGLKKG